jgi:UPF0755 protein
MKVARNLLVLLVGLIVAAAGWFYYAVGVERSHPAQSTQLVIPQGSSFGQIASLLVDRGIVGNALTFRLLGKLQRADSDVHAGEYRFAPHQTQNEVLRQLQSGGAQVAVWVTFPEGFTAKQMAQRLADAGVGNASAFEDAFLHDSIVVDKTRTRGLEGFLFPSTYLIPTDASPAQVERILTNQFVSELPADAAEHAAKLHLTVPQVVTVASLIEREAQADDERPLMAGVYYNRLRLGMPLEVDATIEYALPEHKTALSFADLKVDSPYNSYTHAGLPPTPIANPGASSLAAAFRPAHTDYLYYVYKGDGHHAFAKTLAEHNANVAKYLK